MGRETERKGGSSDSVTPKASDILGADERIILAYLFGSRAKGTETRESDTDVAVLLKELPADALDFYLDLADRLSAAFNGHVDLVILNTAPPLLKREVIRHGKVLFSRDESTRVSFEARSMKEYMDLEPVNRGYDEVLLEELSKWKPS